MPALIAWGMGIPLFALLLLYKSRKTLESIITRQKYGFLFRGYKIRYYFWEIFIMYRKIGLIFIQVFLVTYGVMTQALTVFLLLIVFILLNSKKAPF